MTQRKREEREATERQRRAEQHGCDGLCYTPKSMCPAAETCPETRRGEFAATVGAVIILLAVPVLLAAVVALFILL